MQFAGLELAGTLQGLAALLQSPPGLCGSTAARFNLEDNPQPEADWPVGPLEYADAAMQRIVQEMPFTVADFALCDHRNAAHFARVPKDGWHDGMVPADEWLALDP
ncbi:MAG: hypothetical protein ACK5YG_02840, partial [Alphaproteobacteria bacterium]